MPSHDDPIASRLSALYGELPSLLDEVLYIVACVRREGALHVLKIGEHAPHSATDFLVLQSARALVDCIVTSAAVLRAEPGVRFLPQPPHAEALGHFRLAQRAERCPAELVVVTASGELDAAHPAFAHPGGVRVLAPEDRCAALLCSLPAHVRVEPLPRTTSSSLAPLIDQLRREGKRAISLELGPRAAGPLLPPAGPVTTLWLSELLGEVAPEALGPALAADADLFSHLVPLAAPSEVEEPSGRWRFARYRRAAGI